MLKKAVSAIVAVIFFSIVIGCADGSEIRLISPIGATARSIVPGWGQIYTRSPLQGIFIFLSVGLLAGGGARADSIYRDYYNNKYTPAILADSDQADFYYDRSNQYFKLSRLLFYTAGGIWAYSALDAYVDAHIYNARQQAKLLEIDDGSLQRLKQENKLSKAIVPENGYLSSFCFGPRIALRSD